MRLSGQNLSTKPELVGFADRQASCKWVTAIQHLDFWKFFTLLNTWAGSAKLAATRV